MSRDDDNNKIPHYEEFCQFLLRRVQREFQNYNETNNNELQDPTIVDLRTVGGPSQVHTVPVDMCSYPISNIITVSESNTYAFSSNDRIQYQVLEETNGNAHGSILLKKMLQAPAGANLGEIASPLLGGYRVWSIEQSQTDNLLDNNSDTLTADSEKDENEDNFGNNIECYSLVNNGRDEYFFNESNFIRNPEDLGQQFPNVLTNESQYKFGNTDIDTSQNFPNWTNTITEIGSIVPEIEASSSSTLYYDNAESNCLIKRLNTDLSGCQYNVNENASAYNANQDAFNMSLSGDIQYCQTNIIPISQADASNTYCLQNLTKQLRDINGVYINPINDTSHINLVQNPYIPLTSQGMPNNINQYNGLAQPHSYNNKNQQNDVLSIDPFEQHGYNNSSNNNHNNNNNSNSNNHSNNYGSSNSGNNNNCGINNNNSNAHNHNHHYHHHPHNHPDSENNNNNSSNNNINISSSGNNGNISNNGNNNHSSSSSSSISNNNNHIAISNKNNGNSSSSSTSSNSSSINPKNNINYNNYNNNYNNMYNNDKQLAESNSKTMSGRAGYAFNGILDPFWPTQIFKNSTKHLENILNYRMSSNVDYTKLEQTSCVYCYTAPIVAVKMGSSNLLCSQKKKYVSERREHTFSTNCLLYNDTSAGMRLSNLQVDLDMHSEDRNQTEQLIISDHDNVMMNELGDTVVDSDDSINDVWIHDYNKDSDTTLKNIGTPDDENSACFLSDMNVQDSQVDDISLN